jgi:hypothetical protein
MSSTYSSNLRIELIGSGDQAGAWGATTDSNLAYIMDTAIAGYQAVAITSTSQALTYVNGPSSSAALNQSVYAMLKFTGASAATSVYIPPASKQYIVYNNSGYTITIYNSTVIGNTTAAGTGISVVNGDKIMVWSDATNVFDLQAQNLTGTLAIAKGGTGQTTAQAAINALTGTQTNNRVLRSDGTNATLSQVNVGTDVTGTLAIANGGTGGTTAAALTILVGNLLFPVGAIYSSTAATNPGTALGFGTWTAFGAGRVIIGNGGGFTAGATGGSADSVVVSHTHTATFTGTALAGHTHTLTATTSGSDSPQGGLSFPVYNGTGGEGGQTGTPTWPTLASVSGGTPAGSITVTTEGVSPTNANLQPYIVVYMWQRTA